MNEDQFAVFLAGNRTAYRPGDQLVVTVLWALASSPLSLQARIFWRTQGKGTEDSTIVATQSHAHPGMAGEHAFTFTLPDAPWSFSGKLISLLWAVEVVADSGGQSARAEFVLGPEGKEVLLPVFNDATRA